MPIFCAAGPALAAQRNCLQSLEVELSKLDIYIGRLSIGATIERSAWPARIEADKTAGRASQVRGRIVSPDCLGDLLWSMHNKTMQPEVVHPEGLFDQ